MKKTIYFTLWLLIFTMTFSALPVFAENSSNVEIQFSVGDEILKINGESIQVEKPYVVGEGVTLVPLRVITEAFGAEVTWIAETQSITLSYPDVSILLQINNPTAEVNKNAETLLAAPELTGNGITMVPLRFISETFGATVTYDEATREITVVKNVAEVGNTIVGAIDTKYVGDSYFKWIMENPTDMTMEKRLFDGTYTVFSLDDNNWFDITITNTEEDLDFDRGFIELKNNFSGLTLVKADKDSSNPEKMSMHIQAKDKNILSDVYIYATPTYVYTLWGEFELANADKLEQNLKLLSTFDCSYTTSDTYDLSNVKDGYRRFEIENLGFSMNIPAKFQMASSEDIENEVSFERVDTEDDVSTISIAIYSKSDVGSAQTLAKNDLEHNKRTLNESIATFTGVSSAKEYDHITAYEYTSDINASNYQKRNRDLFFECGDYVYNVNIGIKLPNNVADSYTNLLINSIEVKEADSSEVGILMRNMPDDEGTFKVTQKSWEMELPNSFEVMSQSESGATFQSMIGGNISTFILTNGMNINSAEVREYVLELESTARKTPGVKIIKSTEKVVIGKEVYYEMIYSQGSEEDGFIYLHKIAGVRKNQITEFNVAFPEISYSEHHKNQIYDIIASLTLK